MSGVCMCGFLLLSLARCDVEWGSRWSQGLGEQVHPHHQTALIHSGNDRSQNRTEHGRITQHQPQVSRRTATVGCETKKCSMTMLSGRYLLYVRLQRAVEWSGLHVFWYQSHFPQDVKGQSLLDGTKVRFGHVFVLWEKKNKKEQKGRFSDGG